MNAIAIPPGRSVLRAKLISVVHAAMDITVHARDAERADAKHDAHLVAAKRHIRAAHIRLLAGDATNAARHLAAANRLIEEAEREDVIEDKCLRLIRAIARAIAGAVDALLIAKRVRGRRPVVGQLALLEVEP